MSKYKKKGLELTLPMFRELINRGEIHRTVAKHKLLIIKGCLISNDEYLEIIGSLGELIPSSNPMHGIKEIFVSSESTNVGETWHTDYTYHKNLPKYTCLLCRTLPSIISTTLFLDTHKAYLGLPVDLREKMNELTGIFSFIKAYSKKQKKKGLSLTPKQLKKTDKEHPIVMTHPLTKEKTLILHEEYLVQVKGYDKEESKKMIDEIYQAVFQPQWIYSHLWELNELVLWDNRALLHKKGTCLPEGEKRELYRLIVQ